MSNLKQVNKVQRILSRNASILSMDLVKSLITNIRMLKKQKEYLQGVCRKAGAEIKELKDTVGKLENIAALTTDEILDKMRDAEDYNKTEDYTEEK
tara:strand:+ start:1304 stop:1591 length:288 start_codon:yes stop_codon:yes gene_type:complete